MNRGAFHRAIQLFTSIAAVVKQFAADYAARQDALAALPEYKSRGKGRAGHQRSHRKVAMDKRDARKARNRARNKKAHR
jgi:hypothetical protein